jgi:hypothetical protein
MYTLKSTSYLILITISSAFVGLLTLVPLGFKRKVLETDLKDITTSKPFRVVDDCTIPQCKGIFWTQDQDYGTSLMKFPRSSTIKLNDDRAWTYASWLTTQCSRFTDIRYTFDYNQDHSHAVISMECFHVRISPVVLYASMTLRTRKHEDDSSIVWQRNTTLFGMPLSSGIYKLVQVIDGDGKRLPAFDLYLEYMRSIKAEKIYMLVPT